MYRAEFSLYSGKLSSYLRKKGIAFIDKSPSVLTCKRFIVPRAGVKFIPALHTPEDEVLQDTTAIIDAETAGNCWRETAGHPNSRCTDAEQPMLAGPFKPVLQANPNDQNVGRISAAQLAKPQSSVRDTGVRYRSSNFFGDVFRFLRIIQI